MAKAKYQIQCPVTSAGGSQTFEVEANSEAEAIRLHNDGKSELVHDECEVQSLGEPEVVNVEYLEGPHASQANGAELGDGPAIKPPDGVRPAVAAAAPAVRLQDDDGDCD